MSTLNSLVNNFWNSNSGGRSNRSRGYTARQVKFWINEARAFLIYAQVKKDGMVNVGYEQDLGCVTLQTVDRAECVNFTWNQNIKKVIIPPVLRLPDNAGVTFFGLIDKRTRIYLPDMQYGSLNDLMLHKPKNNREGMMIGNSIYLMGEGSEKLGVVNVRGIFEDPTLVQTCGATGETPVCYDPDVDCYPFPEHLQSVLFQMIDEKYVNLKVQFPSGIHNVEQKETVV